MTGEWQPGYTGDGFTILSKGTCDKIVGVSEGNCVRSDVQDVGEASWGDLPKAKWVEMPAVDSLSQAAGDEIVTVLEIVKNSRDSVVIVKTHDKFGCVQKDAFSSPQAAAEVLFGLPGGNLSRYKEVYPSQRALADQVGSLIIEPGSGRLITLKMLDFGCGVHPRDYGRTFLRSAISDKYEYPYLAAGFGLGGLFITRYATGGQMIVTKLDTAMNGGQEAPWGVLLLRTETKISSDGQQRIYFSYLCGEANGQTVFPAMPPDTVVAVRRNCQIVEVTEQHSLEDRVRRGRSLYEAEHPDETILDFTGFEPVPSKRAKTTARRAVLRTLTAMGRGVLRIIVECNFSSPWAKYNIGENTTNMHSPGLFEAMRRAEPEPSLPISAVDMRWGSGKSEDPRQSNSTMSNSRMVKSTKQALMGLAHSLDNADGVERIDMSIPVALDDVSLGEVTLTAWYGNCTPILNDEGKPQLLMNPEETPFHVLFYGQAIGRLPRDDAIDAVGISGIVDRFVIFLRLEGVNCHAAVRDNGRKLKPNTRETIAIVKAVKAFMYNHRRIAEIRSEAQRAINSTTQAEKISDLLARANEGSAGNILEVGKIKACVRSRSGAKLRRQDAKPKTAVFRKKASYKGMEPSYESMTPTKMVRGSTCRKSIETSSRNPVKWEKPGHRRRRGGGKRLRGYTMKTLVVGDNSGIRAKWCGGNMVEIEVASDAPAAEAAVLVFVTKGHFRSQPAVLKVHPTDAAPVLVMRREPTRLDMSRGLCNSWVSPVAATTVKFKSDVDYDYCGMSGECIYNRRSYPVPVRPDCDGRWAALVPALDGAQCGEKCILVIRANRTGQPAIVREWELVVRNGKLAGGRRKKKSDRVDALDDVPGPNDTVELRVVETEEGLKNLEMTVNDICGIEKPGDSFIGIINRIAPERLKAAKALAREIAQARGSEKRRLEKQERLIEYELGGILTDIIIDNLADAKAKGKPLSPTLMCGSDMRTALRAAAVNHGFFTDIDPASECINRRYE